MQIPNFIILNHFNFLQIYIRHIFVELDVHLIIKYKYNNLSSISFKAETKSVLTFSDVQNIKKYIL